MKLLLVAFNESTVSVTGKLTQSIYGSLSKGFTDSLELLGVVSSFRVFVAEVSSFVHYQSCVKLVESDLSLPSLMASELSLADEDG